MTVGDVVYKRSRWSRLLRDLEQARQTSTTWPSRQTEPKELTSWHTSELHLLGYHHRHFQETPTCPSLLQLVSVLHLTPRHTPESTSQTIITNTKMLPTKFLTLLTLAFTAASAMPAPIAEPEPAVLDTRDPSPEPEPANGCGTGRYYDPGVGRCRTRYRNRTGCGNGFRYSYTRGRCVRVNYFST
jgi:hypothetical protein